MVGTTTRAAVACKHCSNDCVLNLLIRLLICVESLATGRKKLSYDPAVASTTRALAYITRCRNISNALSLIFHQHTICVHKPVIGSSISYTLNELGRSFN